MQRDADNGPLIDDVVIRRHNPVEDIGDEERCLVAIPVLDDRGIPGTIELKLLTRMCPFTRLPTLFWTTATP